ncbi:hypothetical protein IWQ61_007968 [Dispira simplex]|nr:hypothetical protein IWQ61_007968 [Dispira simplex]
MKVSVTFLVLAQLAYLVHATPLPADEGKNTAPKVPPTPEIIRDNFHVTSSPTSGNLNNQVKPVDENTKNNHDNNNAGNTSEGNLGNQSRKRPDGEEFEKAIVDIGKSPSSALIKSVDEASTNSGQGAGTLPPNRAGEKPRETATTGDPPPSSSGSLSGEKVGSSTPPSIPTEDQAQVKTVKVLPMKDDKKHALQKDGKITMQVEDIEAPESEPNTTSSKLVNGDDPQIKPKTPGAMASSLPSGNNDVSTGNDKRQQLTMTVERTEMLKDETAQLNNQPPSTASRGDSDTGAGLSDSKTRAPGQPPSRDNNGSRLYRILMEIPKLIKEAGYPR